MALIRAMNSAISGLRAHQYKIDTIGDNLANVDTTAFKVGRAQFKTLISQTMSYGTAPQGYLGGVDPQQLGLGVQIADTSKTWTQGALKATGINSDLAIEGDGFFILKDEKNMPVYTRDGSFSINPENFLHNPTMGDIVQGYMADFTTFQVQAGGPLTNVQIPIGDLRIARATTTTTLDGNLNGSGDIAASGTVLESEQLLDAAAAPATLNTLLTDLQRADGGGPVDLTLVNGDIIEMSAQKGNRTLPTAKFQISNAPPLPGVDDTGTTLGDLIDFMEDVLGVNNSTTVEDLYSSPVTSGSMDAAGNDVLSAASYDTSGRAVPLNFATLGVEVGDFLRFTTGDGAGQIVRVSGINAGGDTLTFDPANTLDPAVPTPQPGDEWVIQERARVALGSRGVAQTDPPREDNATTRGAIRISGNVGLANGISNLWIAKVGGDRMTLFNEADEAEGESVISNSTVYDSLGAPHVVEVTYVLESKSSLDLQRGNKFRWFAEAVDNNGPDRCVGTGWIQFDTEGRYSSENPQAAVQMDLSNSGAVTPFIYSVDHSQVTAFSNEFSEVAMINQDGYEQGTLTDFSIGQDGIVTGIFSNGQTRNISQIALARFPNNNGLTSVGDNIFRIAANSGLPIVGTPGTFARGTIRGGFLEESNVDMAQQFTDLIVSQRAFQANAKTISVANEMLQDLVNII